MIIDVPNVWMRDNLTVGEPNPNFWDIHKWVVNVS